MQKLFAQNLMKEILKNLLYLIQFNQFFNLFIRFGYISLSFLPYPGSFLWKIPHRYQSTNKISFERSLFYTSYISPAWKTAILVKKNLYLPKISVVLISLSPHSPSGAHVWKQPATNRVKLMKCKCKLVVLLIW